MSGTLTSDDANAFARYPSLAGKLVLITGGASGIGASMVEEFARHAAHVAFIDRDDRAAAELIERERAAGRAAPHFRTCDVRDIASLRTAIRSIEDEFGAVRVLVNNAASDQRHRLEDVTPEYWDDRMHVNLRHQFFAAQAVAPAMREAGGGSIINLGSTSWMSGAAGLIAYTTAKSAAWGLTRSLARELGPAAIRVNCLVPGWTLTERQLAAATPERCQSWLDRQCLKELVRPADVARLAAFLAADDSRLCTGQVFIVDAGAT